MGNLAVPKLVEIIKFDWNEKSIAVSLLDLILLS